MAARLAGRLVPAPEPVDPRVAAFAVLVKAFDLDDRATAHTATRRLWDLGLAVGKLPVDLPDEGGWDQ